MRPRGGFGVERTLAWITGEKHIRQYIPLPRMMDKVYIQSLLSDAAIPIRKSPQVAHALSS